MPAESILVVDDESMIGKIFKLELGSKGYDVDSVLSGEEAVEAVKRKRYALVFIDKVMPGMVGLEIYAEIKRISPDSTLILMTGYFDKESMSKEAQFKAAGGKTHFLHKPFAENELMEVVQEALKGKI